MAIGEDEEDEDNTDDSADEPRTWSEWLRPVFRWIDKHVSKDLVIDLDIVGGGRRHNWQDIAL